jgi:hypothetical protein
MCHHQAAHVNPPEIDAIRARHPKAQSDVR